MVGRGTRIHEATKKYKFWLYDYTGVTDLFGTAFITKPPRYPDGGSGGDPGGAGGGDDGGGFHEPPPVPQIPVRPPSPPRAGLSGAAVTDGMSPSPWMSIGAK